jgi:hypothetical protein
VPAARAGLGHFLTASTVYSDYAESINRTFHIDTKKWSSFLLEPEKDIDPFFLDYFESNFFDQNGVNLSKRSLRQLYSRASEGSWETLVVIPKNVKVQDFMAKGFLKDFNGNMSFMEFPKFRDKYLYKKREHSARLVLLIVSEPTKGGRWMRKVSKVPSLVKLNSQLNASNQKDEINSYVGIHVRHGNGEYLHGRIEGKERAFEKYLDRMAAKAKKLSQKEGLKIMAFSDSVACLDYFQAKHSIPSNKEDNLPDEEWFSHLKSQDAKRKREVIFKVMKDFYFLANCKHVVCGISLFTMAAFLFSKNRSFYLVRPRKILGRIV